MVDPDPSPELVVPYPECPASDKHTPMPAGYMEWNAWAALKTRDGWKEKRCESCGLWVIWVMNQKKGA